MSRPAAMRVIQQANEEELEIPKYLARRVRELYRRQYQDFQPRSRRSVSSAFTRAFNQPGPFPPGCQ